MGNILDWLPEWGRVPLMHGLTSLTLSTCPSLQEITGEPLVCSSEGTWYLVGMMSWGPGCKNKEAPPIFLQVSSYQPWIWDRLSGEPLAPPAPSRTLLLAFLLLLNLLRVL